MTRVAEPAGALTAVAFLTRLPVGRLARHDSDAVAAAAAFFPLVGAAILMAAGVVADASARFAPPFLAGALAVAVLAAVTGGLHLDALADTADALGGWTREDRLRIMRDHSIGAFGATALCLVLVIEVAAIASLVESGASLAAFAAVGAASRALAPPLAAVLPYARVAEAGVSVTRGFTFGRSLAALAAAGAIAAVGGVAGLGVFGAAVVVCACAGVFCRRWIGGVTGDTLGATVQLAEAAGLVVAVGLA